MMSILIRTPIPSKDESEILRPRQALTKKSRVPWGWSGLEMDGAAGEEDTAALRVTFDPRLKLEFQGSKVTSDGGLLACRELDDALGLSETAGDILTDTRTGANGRHTLVGQFRQSVFGRLAGYEDVNDADRLAHDPAMRWIVGGRAATGQAASTSQMGRFETEVMTEAKNLAALSRVGSR